MWWIVKASERVFFYIKFHMTLQLSSSRNILGSLHIVYHAQAAGASLYTKVNGSTNSHSSYCTVMAKLLVKKVHNKVKLWRELSYNTTGSQYFKYLHVWVTASSVFIMKCLSLVQPFTSLISKVVLLEASTLSPCWLLVMTVLTLAKNSKGNP